MDREGGFNFFCKGNLWIAKIMKHERAARTVRVAPAVITVAKEGVRAVVRDTSAKDKLQLPTRCQPTHLNIWAGSNANIITVAF